MSQTKTPRKPDFTRAEHPFTGDFVAWCEDCLHLGLGDLFVERGMEIAKKAAKAEGKPCTVTREQLRFWGYDCYVKQGWDHDTLLRMGFKPIVGDWRDSFPGHERSRRVK